VYPMNRIISCVLSFLFTVTLTAAGEHRRLPLGDRHLAVESDGEAGTSPTVILIAGGGRTSEDWAKVQPIVASFTRVCSYDRAGLGDSDRTSKLQSVGEIVEDLHALLQAAHESGPYILVAHSIAGIYARGFETRFRTETAGLVFVDSSHEEQVMRQQELFNPKVPAPVALVERQGFFVQPAQRLDWQTDVPIVVLSHGKSLTGQIDDSQVQAWEREWRELQQDLAARSPRGQFVVAERSGHFIQLDQPELVIQAIRDVNETH